MNWELIALGFALLLIAAICIVLVFHPKYEDGLFGRMSLLGMSFMAFLGFLEIFSGSDPVVLLRLLTWDAIFTALFMARHTKRFFRWSCTGNFAWPMPVSPLQALREMSGRGRTAVDR